MKLILLFINLISYFCRIFELNIPIILLNFMKAKHLLLLVSMLILSMGGGHFLPLRTGSSQVSLLMK